MILTPPVWAAPAQGSTKESVIKQKIACAEMGWRFFDRVKEEEAAPNAPRMAYLEVRYAYNRELDTCLCSYERLFPDGDPHFSHFFIWDVLSGKMLAHATTVVPEQIAPFEQLWRKLMGIDREEDSLRGRPTPRN